MEALGLASVQYNYLHKYSDDPNYTKKSPFNSTSPKELLEKLAKDERFDGIFSEPGFDNMEPLFQKHESLVLEYWNAWELSDPAKQFQESQEVAVALLVATVPPETHSYNFFMVHILTTSHAVRTLLPFLPAKYHLSLVRQWWLLTLAVYISELRPKIDPDYIPKDLKDKGWKYIDHQVMNVEWSTDAHFVKGKRSVSVYLLRMLTTDPLAVRSIKMASQTWGDADERYLAAAVRFVDDFKGWAF